MYSMEAQKTYRNLYTAAQEKLAEEYEVQPPQERDDKEVDNETSATCR